MTTDLLLKGSSTARTAITECLALDDVVRLLNREVVRWQRMHCPPVQSNKTRHSEREDVSEARLWLPSWEENSADQEILTSVHE